MIVVADTSPLNYLLQIDLAEVLPSLYSQIAIPDAVLLELRNARAPEVVRRWAIGTLPDWVTVQQPTKVYKHTSIELDLGESEAIQLAIDLQARLLIDERKGWQVASELGLLLTGTVGVLRDAHRAGFIDGHKAYEALKAQTNFRSGKIVEAEFLASLKD